MTTTECPRCGEPVEVVLGPLQPYCLSCDLTFDVQPATAVGDGPMRALEVVLPAAGPPPTRHIRELSRDHLRIGQAGPGIPQVLAVFVLCYVAPAAAESALAIPLAAAAAAIIVLWWLDGREEIAVEGGKLVATRGVLGFERTREIPLGEVRAVETTRSSVKLRLRDGARIPLARGLGHRRESLEWLGRRVERQLQRAS